MSAFIGIIAFAVAVFTLASPKYQFRQATALLPFRTVFFVVLVISAVFTILIEAFVMYGVKFPAFFKPNTANYFIAVAIAFLILYWMKISFIWPPKFSRLTAGRFGRQAFVFITNGNREDLLAVAQELMREFPRLISHSPVIKNPYIDEKEPLKLTAAQGYANDIFLLIADPRFCKVVADEIPILPARLCEEMVHLKRFDAPAHRFIRRIVIELLGKPGSALFVENEWLAQSFAGEVKPITRSIFYYWHLLEKFERGLESPLALDYPHARNWDTDTWRVYFGLALEYVRGLTSSTHRNSNVRGVDFILQTTQVAYQEIGNLERYENSFDPHNPYWHASEANDFLTEFVKIFSESGEHVYFVRTDRHFYGHDLSSRVARLLNEAVLKASLVNTKEFRMWQIQHNLIWNSIQRQLDSDTKIWKMVRRKLRRLIWDEVKEMDHFPNHKGAIYIRFCLNVLGFYDEKVHRRDSLKKDSWVLAKVVSEWVAKNYQTIVESHPPVAEAMLPADIVYDPEKQVLVRTKENPLTGIPRVKELPLNPPKMPAG